MYYVVYRDQRNEWRWTFYSENHRKIADSAEGYKNKSDCEHGLHLIALSKGAPIRYPNG